jgi:hypothetical protein
MNELELLNRLGVELDPPEPVPPAALRRRALTRPARPARRFTPAWRLVVAGGLAAAIAGGLYLIGALTPDPAAHTPISGSPTGTGPARPGGAALVLHNAALTAGRQKALPAPRADQFVFSETVTVQTGQTEQPDGTMKTETSPPQRDQLWESVDGTHDGLMRERPESDPSGWRSTPLSACADGKEDIGAGQTAQCTPDPAYSPGMPTDPTAMLSWLYANSHGDNQRDEQAFITAHDLLGNAYLRPEVEAALFEALARLPGVTVTPDLADLTGRHGIGIGMGHLDPSDPVAGRSPATGSDYLIFDPTTYDFLGTNQATLVRQAIVDRPGQLP